MAASPPRGLNVRQRMPVSARARQAELPPQLVKYVQTGETLVAEPFKGITLDGRPLPDLFPIQKTGISTAPITDAARAFLASLSDGQRARALFALESDAWRRWSNIHPFLMRHGVSPRRDERGAARLRARADPGEPERPGIRDGARRHAAERARPGDHRQPGRVRRVALLAEHHGDAVGRRALGLADRRAPPHRELLRPRRSGRDDADVHGLGAGGGARRTVRRHARVRGRGAAAGSRSCAPSPPSSAARRSSPPSLPGEVFTAAFRDNFELQYEGIRGRPSCRAASSACCSTCWRPTSVASGPVTPAYGSTR